jgi:hypothetical protein
MEVIFNGKKEEETRKEKVTSVTKGLMMRRDYFYGR